MARRRKCSRCKHAAIAYLIEADGSHTPLCFDHVPIDEAGLAAPLSMEQILEQPDMMSWRRLIPIKWLGVS
jgi:hypothetical protein